MIGAQCSAGVLQVALRQMEPTEDGAGVEVHINTETGHVVCAALKAIVWICNAYLGLATVSPCVIYDPIARLAQRRSCGC